MELSIMLDLQTIVTFFHKESPCRHACRFACESEENEEWWCV